MPPNKPPPEGCDVKLVKKQVKKKVLSTKENRITPGQVKCNEVISIPQISGTCWFNSILMSVLFSQYSRGLLMNLYKKNEHDTNFDTEIHSIIKDIVVRRYVTSKQLRDYAYMYFEKVTPEYILKQLHEHDKSKFNFDPDKRVGYFNYLYLPRFLEFLGVKDILMLDWKNDNLYYSVVNKGLTIETANKNDKDTKYIVKTNTKNIKLPTNIKKEKEVILIYVNNRMTTNKLIQSDFKLKEEFVFGGITYVLDSVLLSNFNYDVCQKAHDICGMSCANKKYIYNGWIRSTVDPAMKGKVSDRALPCEIIEYDWVNNNEDFCLNLGLCKLDKTTYAHYKNKELCFNPTKGYRVYIYVNKEKSKYSFVTSPSNDDKIKLTPINTKPKVVKTKTKDNSHKICPSDKVLNPNTNRCIKKDGALAKKLKLV